MKEHFDSPRNQGSFSQEEENVATGVVGAPECGDVMKLQLKINDEGIIEDARFKTFGCSTTIASASFLTEYLKGRSVDDAVQVDREQICEELCLPPARVHCTVMVEDALKAALEDWKRQHEVGASHGN